MRGRNAVLGAALGLVLLAGAAHAQGYLEFANGAAGDTTAVGMADSSTVKFLRGLSIDGLYFKAASTTLSAAVVARVAIQVRWHKDAASDSVSIGVFEPVVRTSEYASATVDSVTVFGDRTDGSSVACANNEFVIQFDREPGGLWQARHLKIVDFRKVFGAPLRAEWLSIRWRVLSGPGVMTTWCGLLVSPR